MRCTWCPSLLFLDTQGRPKVQSWSAGAWKGLEEQRAALQDGQVTLPHIVVQFLARGSLEKAMALLSTGVYHPMELGMLPLEASIFPM